MVARMSFASQDTDFSVSEVESVPLYVTLAFSFLGFVATIVFYILTAKCTCCKQCSCSEKSLLERCCGASSCTETKKQQPSSYCSSSVRTKVLTVLQLCAKLLLVLTNIIYIVVTVIEATSDTQQGNGSNQSNMTADNRHVGMAGQYVSALSAAWEIVSIIFVLLSRVSCWLFRVCRKKEECSFWEFLEYLRFGDLQITSLLVPLGNVSLFHGDARFVVSLIRMAFYAITFITDVVNGDKCNCCCSFSSKQGPDNNTGKIKNRGYAVTRMAMKGIEILLKMITSSSAIATFLFTGLNIPIVPGVFYLIFTLLCGITATGSLCLSAIVTRWEVVEKGGNTQAEGGIEIHRKVDDQDDDHYQD